ncbi:DUF1365 domain-containing protein [Acidihalobacter ferrooxydans]|uniref:DUF1365 domain-containing protein n=1 Tax=Acidihalobacter ferrooxydans TaxID=1765967 RepID=A0A1P8UEU2_9GAMM|nr:DUF1365 domain-containing protein [Acidihalobacter ferrooxydans]APZ42367.1 hypothetical protein BW247_04065 [Acidihalobacter ferrooxydans]
MDTPGRLYRSTVMHQRHDRFGYRFEYRLFTLLLDIDRIDEACARSRLLRHNRRAPLAFHDRDHGPRDGSALRPWIDSLLGEAGIDLDGGQVLLLALPRLWGYGFNPLSLWYCRHRDGSLRAVIAEVSNTFGECHHYLLHDAGQPLAWPLRKQAEKLFHVSPFIGMRAQYHFHLAEPGDTLGVAIREYQDDALLLVATQTGQGTALTDRALLAALARFPLASFKVITLIHWQALKLWLRRAPLFHKPPPSVEDISR